MTHHQQHNHRDSNSMAAATAAYHDQMAGGSMGMSMDQHFGGQNANFYSGSGDSGFYQIDQAHFDSQNPPPIDPNQTPLLSHGEQDALQTFFDDPNNSLNPFDFSVRPDEKPALNGDSVYGAAIFDHRTGTINQSATAGQSHLSLQRPHVNTSGLPNFSTGQQDLSADDYRAARTIDNLRSSDSADFPFVPTTGGFAGSWGNFVMPTSSTNMNFGNMDNSFAGAFANTQNNHMQAANQARHSSQQHGVAAPGVPQQHFYAHAQPAPPQQQSSRTQSDNSAAQHAARPQSQSSGPFHTGNPTLSTLPHGHGRPPLMSWGSDSNFNGPTFTAPTAPPQQNKEGNLLNIYGAEQAARDAQNLKNNRRPPGRNSVASPATAQNAATWGQMGMNAPSSSFGRDDQTQPRKRRKSQADEEDRARVKTEESDDDGYGDAAKGAPKRRKSTYNRQSIASNSPAPDDDGGEDDASGLRKRRAHTKKPRETLSEAQKRDNHIKSEKKRREIINTGYNDLNSLVPILSQGKSGLSRSECLTEVSSYLRTLVEGTNLIMSRVGLPDAEWREAWREIQRRQQAASNNYGSLPG